MAVPIRVLQELKAQNIESGKRDQCCKERAPSSKCLRLCGLAGDLLLQVGDLGLLFLQTFSKKNHIWGRCSLDPRGGGCFNLPLIDTDLVDGSLLASLLRILKDEDV